MLAWDKMVKSAIIGIERQDLSFDDCGDDALASLLRGLDTADRERYLLMGAALAALYLRAGLRAAALETEQPAAALPDRQPPAPTDCMSDLLTMLGGEYREALSEWLEAAAKRGWHIPEEHLTALLDFSASHPQYRTGILPMLGERGKWLAAQNPSWSSVLKALQAQSGSSPHAPSDDTEIEQIWETGAPDERVQLIRALRRTEPDRVRSMIEATWSTESHEARVTLLGALRIGLGIADEPLLESALDDRRKEVRSAAQSLLRRLPGSSYSNRMWERARQCVRVETSFLRASSLAITLPAECDKSMARDGIERKPPGGMGEGAWLLHQIVAATPLSRWSVALERTPEQLTTMPGRKDAAGSQEWKPVLVNAWISALDHDLDPAWVPPLFKFWIENVERGASVGISWHEMMPAEQFEAGMTRLLQRLGAAQFWISNVSELLLGGTKPWSLQFGREMLEMTAKLAQTDPYAIAHAIRIADRLPGQLEQEHIHLLNKIASSDRYSQNQLAQYLALNQFRTEMRRKLSAAVEN